MIDEYDDEENICEDCEEEITYCYFVDEYWGHKKKFLEISCGCGTRVRPA